MTERTTTICPRAELLAMVLLNAYHDGYAASQNGDEYRPYEAIRDIAYAIASWDGETEEHRRLVLMVAAGLLEQLDGAPSR